MTPKATCLQQSSNNTIIQNNTKTGETSQQNRTAQIMKFAFTRIFIQRCQKLQL
ncbi:4885_t:CDS:2 [Gigaspora margarita]|uniref:4885_t:CDS:1 n=1 Tax=Gigaspora margarita TaxID=4874 RepID=A0ABN7V443_GIGMA|nr:4885_t:CDS:2 [Gigaspora margarita]